MKRVKSKMNNQWFHNFYLFISLFICFIVLSSFIVEKRVLIGNHAKKSTEDLKNDEVLCMNYP